jgi:DNA-binding NtrC family response regulator
MDQHNWPVILIVEDDEGQQWYYNDELERKSGGRIAFLKAHDLATAQQLFDQNSEQIDVIVVDGRLPKSHTIRNLTFSTEFVMNVRQTFKGPMIAASDMSAFNDKLMAAGCDHRVDGKSKVPDKVLELVQ